MPSIRERTIRGLKVGDRITIARTFTEEEMAGFAGITRDYNPVHFDDRFAASKKFKGRICHGLLTAAMITEIGGQIGMLATGMTFAFKKPVYFGDTITCQFTILEIGDKGKSLGKAVLKNQAGQTVIEAELAGMLPSPRDIDVMKAMVAEGDPTNGLRAEGGRTEGEMVRRWPVVGGRKAENKKIRG